MELPHAEVPDTAVMLSADILNRLDHLVQNMFANGTEAASIYRKAAQFVGELLLNEVSGHD